MYINLLYIQVFSIIIAAYTTEITIGGLVATEPSVVAKVSAICYVNPAAEHSDHRICSSLIAAAISSIMVCMILMIFDAFIPCVNNTVSTNH